MEEFQFSVRNFEGWFNCYDSVLGRFWTTCDEFNYDFTPGVYALTGQFDDGGWAFAYALTNECAKKQLIDQEAEFYIRGQRTTLQELSKHVQNLGFSHPKKWSDRMYRNTVHERIEKGIKKTGLSWTAEEVRQMFRIDPERFERNIRFVGFEAQKCNAAIGLVNGKKIFCFPYLTESGILISFVQNICEVLREQGCIVLMPVYDTSYVEGLYDYEINIRDRFLAEHPE